MVRSIRWRLVAAIAAGLVVVSAGVAFAVTYTWSAPARVGGVKQYGEWMNGVAQLGQTVDKSVTPAVTYTHFTYISDYNLQGAYANDSKCANQGICLSAWYVRSTNGGKTWSSPPVQLPAPASGNPYERPTLGTTGSTVIVAYMDQTSYYQGGSSLNVNDPRFIYVTRSTNNGGAWSAAKKLPGQTNTSRGDYVNIAASGANVYVVTTNTQNGQTWFWRSTDRGKSWQQPVSLGTTTATDNTTGYVGGFSGLPSVGARGTTVLVAWTSTAAGALVARVSTNGGTSFGSATTLQASGSNDNNGYVQVDSRDTRIAVAWTTAAGAFLRIYDTTGAGFGVKRTIVTFPDAGVDNAYNDGGEGPIVGLGPNQIVGVSLSECNTVTVSGTDYVCNDPTLLVEGTREALVWRASADNGATWSTPTVLQAPATPQIGWEADYGDVTYVKAKPLVIWNSHDAAYNVYENRYSIGTPA